MVYLSIAFLCSIFLFLTLLEDKYRLPVAVASYGAVYLLSLGISRLIGVFVNAPAVAEPVSMLVHAFLLFLLSLFIYRNNPIQKLYLAVLSTSNYLFVKVFSELLLGQFPFSVSGVFAALFSILLYILFTMFIILCMYHVLHHFQDRDTSAFIIIITLLQSLPCIICIGRLDFLFEAHILAGRIFLSATIYAIILFAARSVYQAARFRQNMMADTARRELLDTQSTRYIEMHTYVQELHRRREEEDYRLQTIAQMLKEGAAKKVPQYIKTIRETENASLLLSEYTDNPYLNAILAVTAAHAEKQEIAFTCSILLPKKTIPTSDICLISNEMLHKALTEVSHFSGEKRVSFRISTGRGVIKLELIYSARQPKKKKPSISIKNRKDLVKYLKRLNKKRLSEMLAFFIHDHPENSDLLEGLSFTRDIVNRYSGKMDISTAENNIIVSVQIHI